ncbi:hypothetical protein PEC331060_12010 [Pectobacterium carotovorum subsp. carotovorum]|nr:hypothetical protein PCC21_005660 [Pectobacterium carotovorum subsp. carotovorum PCC21]GKV97293.1 hypothetical protein PEC301653_03390 [Pectobacterium carotovorum subsp. carotovorum]GKW28023.1 hypothetical protein PEC331060_12010 [Pectobacterium carotovorum subsp. carotovorum]
MSNILTCVLSGIAMFTAVGAHAAEKGKLYSVIFTAKLLG